MTSWNLLFDPPPPTKYKSMEEIHDVIVSEYTSTSYEHSHEDTPLMGGKTRKPWSDWLRQVHRRSRKCVSSRAALLILVWNFVVAFVSESRHLLQAAGLFLAHMAVQPSYFASFLWRDCWLILNMGVTRLLSTVCC